MGVSEQETPAHPLDDLIGQIQSFSDEDIRGTDRLGSLAFDEAPAQARAISGVLRDLRLEDWNQLDEAFKLKLIDQAEKVVQTLNAMRGLNASDP